MKYFRIFNSTADYIAYMATEDAVVPNISYCSGDDKTYITPDNLPPPPHVDVTGVTLDTSATTINVGKTVTLVATVLPNNASDKTVTWSSDDTSIATVTNNGNVTAVGSGTCTITVTTNDGGYTASCEVTVEVKDYLKFVPTQSATFSFTNPIEYSLDGGGTWVELAANTSTPTIASGEEICWRHTINRSTPYGIGTFSATGNFNVEGNVMSLLYGDDFEEVNSVGNHALQYLFSGNTKLISAENMLLPANQLGASSYDNMFFGCTNLTTPPELPAERLANYCYRSMFEECTSLTSVPELNAEYVYEGSYQYMFYHCTSLTTVQEKLPANGLDIACYDSMFEYCTSLVQAPELPAKILESQCYNHMFHGCSSLNFIKAAFVTTPNTNYTNEWVKGVAEQGTFFKGYGVDWDVVGIHGVPSGWTIVTFDNTSLAFSCKEEEGCDISFTGTTDTPLYYTVDYGTNWIEYTQPVSLEYNDIIMFKGSLTATTDGIGTFGSTGNFNAYGNILSLVYGDNFTNYTTARDSYQFNHLFEGCEYLVETHELVLPTGLTPYCFANMFNGCESIEDKVPELKATTLAEGCYSYMFKDCSYLYIMPELSATTLAVNCYAHMFEGCSYLTTVNALSAETLVSGCYDYMFADTSVWYVKALFLTAPGTAYTNNWLSNVYEETGTFYINSEATWNIEESRGPSGIPAYKDENDEYTWIVYSSGYDTRWTSLGTSCSGTSMSEHFKEQETNDGGTTWTDMLDASGNVITKDDIIVHNSVECGFVSGNTDSEYDLELFNEGELVNADLVFTEVEGKPNVKTDEYGVITEFTYTDASADNPVMFNGDALMDTAYHPFTTGGKDFEIIFKCYADYNDQTYSHEGDNDGLANILTVRGEGSYNYGFSFRFSDKSTKSELALNGNYVGGSFGNPKYDDDGTHLWYWKVTYSGDVFTIYDLKNNVQLYRRANTDFGTNESMSVVLAAAVDSNGNYFRIGKCKFMEFSMRTLDDPGVAYRWQQVPISEDYDCHEGDKYYVEYRQVSTDSGETWTNVSPIQARRGNLYESGSTDCDINLDRYFTIESLEDDNVIHLRRSYTSNTEYYSTDSGTTWTAIESGSGDKTITTLNSGDTMWVKCTTTKWATAYNVYNNFYSTKNIIVYGNIMSLLNGDNFATARTITASNALAGLFWGTTSAGNSAQTNTTLISAENLVLPATTLNVGSYNGMFRNCTSLTACTKVLPALTLYQDTYSSMFEGCTSLVEGPEIMATTLASSGATGSMGRMFCMSRSTKVTAAMTKGPVLRIDNASAKNTYRDLFRGNGNLTEVTILATSIYSGTDPALNNWLTNTSSSGVIKKYSSLTLPSGNSGLPSGWTTENIDS